MFLRYHELAQSAFPLPEGSVAVLPLAAVESHGPHLPLGTDGLIAEGILDRAGQCLGTTAGPYLRLPLLWLGASTEHGAYAGTLSQEPEDLITQILAVGEGLRRAGLTRLLLFNGHGGNTAAAALAALKLRDRCGFLAASAHWLDFGLPEGLRPPAPAREDVHGGWIETSVLLHLMPALVHLEPAGARPPRAPAPSLFPQGPIAWGWRSGDLASGGWIGRPDLAQPALGRALVEHAAAGLCGLLDELSHAAWPPA